MSMEDRETGLDVELALEQEQDTPSSYQRKDREDTLTLITTLGQRALHESDGPPTPGFGSLARSPGFSEITPSDATDEQSTLLQTVRPSLSHPPPPASQALGTSNSSLLLRVCCSCCGTDAGAPTLTRRTTLSSRILRPSNPYSDLQLLWFREKQTTDWPPASGSEYWELVRLADAFWSSEQKDRVKRLDALKTDASTGRNELYQLVGFYTVFLGVFFSAAAQTNNLKCVDWPILVVLSVIVTIFTLVGFFQKSSELHTLQEKINTLQQERNHHQSQIKKLREQGHEYPFASPPHQVEEKESSSFDIAKILPIAILAFSATICFGIYFILCRTEETCEGKGLSIQSTPRF